MRDYGGEVPADRDVLTTFARRRAQDSQRGDELRLRGRNFAVDTHIFPGTNRTAGAGQELAGGGEGLGEEVPPALPSWCAPLADPARTLCRQGAA